PDAAGDQRHQGDDWPPGEAPREPGVRDQPAPLREGGGHGRCGEKGAGAFRPAPESGPHCQTTQRGSPTAHETSGCRRTTAPRRKSYRSAPRAQGRAGAAGALRREGNRNKKARRADEEPPRNEP
ncbi:unnamed protein product, partial [Ectocarpus sp. 8 AP-2014]